MLRTIANCEAGAALSDCPKSFLNMGDYLGLPRADCEQTEAMRPNDADHGLKFRAALPDVKRSCYALHET
ncbi:hypothetical protein D3C78_1862220 [compost metagenome]